MKQKNNVAIQQIANPDHGPSVFLLSTFALSDYPSVPGMSISEQQSALNFRHRNSKPGYKSDWHVAGDATLIIIRGGTLRITLRNKDSRDFSTGDMFVAADYLPTHINFDEQQHGHMAEVIGDEQLQALHIKLFKQG